MICATLLCLEVTACRGGGDDSSSSDATAAARKSTNWSGYVQSASINGYSKVSGSWTVPAVDCSANDSTASSSWAGIGGGSDSDPTLIQAGSEQDCNGGPEYSAWWEVFPAPSIGPSGGVLSSQSFEVQPGDQMTVSIDGGGTAVWSITIRSSRGWTFNTTVPFGTVGQSAEWIEESPLSTSTLAQCNSLSDFGRIVFSGLSSNGADPQLGGDERFAMVDCHGSVISNPSGPSASGNAFAVCFGSGACR